MKIERLTQIVKPRGTARPSEQDIVDVEEFLVAKIPEPLRSILKELDSFYFSASQGVFIAANGKAYCPQRFLGICDQQKSILGATEQLGCSISQEWLPFAEDLFGNLFFFNAHSGEVAFVDYDEHDGANGYEPIAQDMRDFFRQIEVS